MRGGAILNLYQAFCPHFWRDMFLPTKSDRLRLTLIMDYPSTFLAGRVFADKKWWIEIASNTGLSVHIFGGTCFCRQKGTEWDYLKYWTIHPHFWRDVFLPTKSDGLRLTQILDYTSTFLPIKIDRLRLPQILDCPCTFLTRHVFAFKKWLIKIPSNTVLSVRIFDQMCFCRSKLMD